MKLRSLTDLSVLLPEGAKPSGDPAPDHAGPGPRTGASGKHDGKGKEVRLSLDRKGRKGKTVTLVSGLRHNPDTMKEIAHILKERCGSGGTVKEGNIELQGDQRERAKAELEKMNYIVR